MSEEDEVKVEETPKKVAKKIRIPLDPERMESRQRAHEFKVAKFLAGGKY